ncbi:MAG: tRNA (adenosine(37)-N6)-threonylcarbamoyltransferase complex dimerization subunit type 1 TsaB [Deltaproteobacteria bacterium]|nr:tRNA (adenosine(37)-N6)-threonylcarbamoyltransferase complex dimerization subunit type 1 TsaB [Deltaproteobacteria bacterium]
MLLAINTSTLQFALALLGEDGTLLAEYLMPGGKGHFGSLMPTLDFMLNTSKFEIKDVTCISVATGPGSFTGLRVGLSLAKGLCHALRIPIVGISTLEALASQIPYVDLSIVSVLTSRKGEAFTARFTWNNKKQLTRESEDASVKFDAFPALFQKPTLFVGNDYGIQGTLLKELLGNRAILAPAHCWCVRASSIGSFALDKFLSHNLDDPLALNPVYLRPPDIRPNPFPLLTNPSRPS